MDNVRKSTARVAGGNQVEQQILQQRASRPQLCGVVRLPVRIKVVAAASVISRVCSLMYVEIGGQSELLPASGLAYNRDCCDNSGQPGAA